MRRKFALRRQQQAQAHEGALAPVRVRLAAGEAFEAVALLVRAAALARETRPIVARRLRRLIEEVAQRL
jgi:hypothetical protein